MINRTQTLKAIKEKVDGRTNNKIKIRKPFFCEFIDGIFRTPKRRRITTLIKDGNSVMWIDDAYEVRNITVLDTQDLHKILWGLLSDKEKKEIALEHLLTTKTYLV